MPHYKGAMRPQELNDYEVAEKELHLNGDRVFCVFDAEQDGIDTDLILAHALYVAYPPDDTPVAKIGQPFAEQPTAKYRYGTAFLVGYDLVATAKHILEAIDPVTDARFVRRFEKGHDGRYYFSDVHSAVKIENLAAGDMEEDWAIVRISGPIHFTTPVNLAPMEASVGTAIYVIGHPTGLSAKLVFGYITSVDGNKYQVRMDGYSGNSGSPVFRADTHELIGIWSAGQQDYEDGVVKEFGEEEEKEEEKSSETIVSSLPLAKALEELWKG